MTLQDVAIERLALRYGRVSVRDGFADGHINVTAPNGERFRISEEGVAHPTQPNFSIDWNA